MATTVISSFTEFHLDKVNIASDRSTKAKSSRDWLWGKLNKLDEDAELKFPFHFEEKNLNYGSFVRKTKIRELDDIDIMFCLKGNGAYYSKNGDIYTIHTEDAGERLKFLSNEDTLNSRRVVNKLKSALGNIEHYKSADLHNRGEAVTLSLQSYEWVFDVVPCFHTDTNLYLIPDGNGNFKATDPRIDQSLVTETNQNYSGRLLQLIRTIKIWKNENSVNSIGSYLLEQYVINYTKNKIDLSEYIDYDLRDFFKYFETEIFSSVWDPKNIQGNLNQLSYSEKESISEQARLAHDKAVDAISAEIDNKDQEKSINKWREIFGDKFPQYG
ncbi:nucleotidyltransferase (plasmid) [Chryseobacterium sp. SNU WT5]|uniref:SMODS domain-containing nucleotidyltransferase n=1 Tax=Chryseobacterium sp. SNU WT5 TaxID=2594269 RepID=UPI00117E9363|nr:nucleotidyltransferase [Chryseobacterium sp. SNU WT5]QDP86739.1 nucleotidyltransferase [Chryseobacterium sp. SNU WT5]